MTEWYLTQRRRGAERMKDLVVVNRPQGDKNLNRQDHPAKSLGTQIAKEFRIEIDYGFPLRALRLCVRRIWWRCSAGDGGLTQKRRGAERVVSEGRTRHRRGPTGNLCVLCGSA